MEKQLVSLSSEADHQSTEHHYQVAHLKTISQHDHDALQQRMIELTKELEMLRAEVSVIGLLRVVARPYVVSDLR